jgi:hypothetical protein
MDDEFSRKLKVLVEQLGPIFPKTSPTSTER